MVVIQLEMREPDKENIFLLYMTSVKPVDIFSFKEIPLRLP